MPTQEEEALGPGAAVFPYVWFLGLLYPLLVAVQIFFVLSGAGPVARGIASVLRMRRVDGSLQVVACRVAPVR